MTQRSPAKVQREDIEGSERCEKRREDGCGTEKAIVELFSACRLMTRRIYKSSIPAYQASHGHP
jgi:hypothetical protein